MSRKLDASVAEYHFGVGAIYRRKEMVEESIAAYRKAVDLKPAYAEAWYDLAIMHRANHDNDLAIAAFSRYLELTRGKDAEADKRVEEDIKKLGGDPKATGKKPAKGKKSK